MFVVNDRMRNVSIIQHAYHASTCSFICTMQRKWARITVFLADRRNTQGKQLSHWKFRTQLYRERTGIKPVNGLKKWALVKISHKWKTAVKQKTKPIHLLCFGDKAKRICMCWNKIYWSSQSYGMLKLSLDFSPENKNMKKGKNKNGWLVHHFS